MQPEAQATGHTFVAEIHLAFNGNEPVAHLRLPGAPDKFISTEVLAVAGRIAEAAKAAWVEVLSDAPQHAATCANDGPADVCGCRSAPNVSAPEVPELDPLTIMGMARERVLAHGGSFAETVRDLVEAHEVLRKTLSRPAA